MADAAPPPPPPGAGGTPNAQSKRQSSSGQRTPTAVLMWQAQEPEWGWYWTLKELEQFLPSRRDGYSLEQEMNTQQQLCAFIQEAGIKLSLAQLTIATAMTFFHRFYTRFSLSAYEPKQIATACLFLAGKVEETPKHIKEVVNVTYCINNNTQARLPDRGSPLFWQLKEDILKAERVVLQAISFNLSVEHPYKFLLKTIKDVQGSRDLAQVAWNFVNDSLRTLLCLQYDPKTIACAAIYLAAKFLNEHPSMIEGQVWHQFLRIRVQDLEDISQQILDLYEKSDEGGRVQQQQTPNRAGSAGAAQGPPPGAPNSASRNGTPGSRGQQNGHAQGTGGPMRDHGGPQSQHKSPYARPSPPQNQVRPPMASGGTAPPGGPPQ